MEASRVIHTPALCNSSATHRVASFEPFAMTSGHVVRSRRLFQLEGRESKRFWENLVSWFGRLPKFEMKRIHSVGGTTLHANASFDVSTRKNDQISLVVSGI